jgi:hypothetical protein
LLELDEEKDPEAADLAFSYDLAVLGLLVMLAIRTYFRLYWNC